MKCSSYAEIDKALEAGEPFTLDACITSLSTDADISWFGDHEDVVHERIRKEGMQLLLDAILQSKTLVKLRIECLYTSNDYNETRPRENGKIDGIRFISSIIENNPYILCLECPENYLSDEGTIIISEALRKNKTLEKLDFYECALRVDGYKALTSAILSNLDLPLKILFLDFDPHLFEPFQAYEKHQHAVYITNLIEKNKTILVLSLWGHSFKDDIALLVNALQINKTMRVLHIEYTELGFSQVKALVDVFSKNTTLIKLFLYYLDLTSPTNEKELTELYEKDILQLGIYLRRNTVFFSLFDTLPLIIHFLKCELLPELVSFTLMLLYDVVEHQIPIVEVDKKGIGSTETLEDLKYLIK